MGRSLFRFTNLIPPIGYMEERYAIIPAGQTLETASTFEPKIVCFLEGGVDLILPDERVIPLEAWDVLTLRLPWTLRYRGRDPHREARNHIIGMRLRTGEDSPTMSPYAVADIRERLEGFRHYPQALARIGPQMLQEIREETEQGESWSRWRISGIALRILGTLLDAPRKVSPPEDLPVDRGLAMVNHARQYIQEHARERLTLTQIAWQLQLSGEHLARLFKQHAGYTVFDYVDQVRLEHAKKLLLTTDLPIAQVAPMCGFGSANLLGRHFKARMGQTPLDYRLRGRQQERFSPSSFSK